MDKSKIDEVYNRDIGIARLKSLIERLRDPENGCPWDMALQYVAPYKGEG